MSGKKPSGADVGRFERHDMEMLLAAWDLAADLEERCALRVYIKMDRTRPRGSMFIDARAYRNGEGSEKVCVARYATQWPNGVAMTFSAAVFRAMIQLDRLAMDALRAEVAPPEDA